MLLFFRFWVLAILKPANFGDFFMFQKIFVLQTVLLNGELATVIKRLKKLLVRFQNLFISW